MKTKSRGIVNSVELLLIVAIVVAIALATIFYLSKNVSAEASSPKPLVSVASGKMYLFMQNGQCTHIVVTLQVTNQGYVPVTVNKIGIIDNNGADFSAASSYALNPGETRILSVNIPLSRCPKLNIGGENFAYIQYVADKRTFRVGRPVPVIRLS